MKKLIEWLKGLLKKEAKRLPKIEDIKPEQKGCGCDLNKPLVWPPYTDAMLQGLGNSAECPLINGKDVRLAVMRPDGNAWLIGMLLPAAVTVDGNMIIPHCFSRDRDGDNGYKYHYIGWSTSDLPKDIIRAKPGDAIPYPGTMFVYYECREAR